MNTDNLTSLLRDATHDLEPSAGFAKAVLHGGRRRQVRSRIAVATTVTAVAALVGSGTYALVVDDQITTNEIMAGWLDGTTRGPLATNQPFLQEALTAWETGKTRSPNASAGIFDDVRSDAHVYWAGNTPAGRAAVVVQQAYLHPHDQLPSGAADTLQTLVGLVAVDPKDNTLKLVGDQFRVKPDDPVPGAFLFGPKSKVLLVVDNGEAVWERHLAIGTNPGVAITEEQERAVWQRLPDDDGVAFQMFEYPGGPESIVKGPDPIATSATRLSMLWTSRYLTAAAAGGTGPLTSDGANVLGWPRGDMLARGPGGPGFGTGEMFFMGVAPSGEVRFYVDDDPATVLTTEKWHVRALLPDGRTAVLGSYAKDGQPHRIGVVLVTPDFTVSALRTGDVINRNIPLPVRYHLPDGQGWLVAAHGKALSYRTDGDWQDAGRDAALLPDDATQVKVDDTVVDLPR